MYIFELIYKIVKSVKNRKIKTKEESSNEVCEHIYLPVDSTKEILACTKCGKLIKTKDIKQEEIKQ